MIFAFVFGIYVALLLLAPFPHWPTYFLLWKHTLKRQKGGGTLSIKRRQVLFLFRYLLLTPFWSLGWLLDEIFYPDYRYQKINGPVFIAAQPRSGTTFFHRTLAEDEENFIAIRHYEWRFPFICFQKFISWCGLVHFISSIRYWPHNEKGDLAHKMHRHVLGDWEEDGIFFEERFLRHYFIYRRFPYPEFLREMVNFDLLPIKEQEHILDIHNRILKKIVYLRGRGRVLLLKENECADMLPSLEAAYPEATFIALVRPSGDFIRSYRSLSIQSTLAKTELDPSGLQGWEEENLRYREKQCRLQIDYFSDYLPAKRQLKLSYPGYLADIKGSTELIYTKLGLMLSENGELRLNQIIQRQKKRKRGYEVDRSRDDVFNFYDVFYSMIHDDHMKELDLRAREQDLSSGRATKN